VKGFQVHRASPVMSALRFSTAMTTLPGVCPGVCTTRGEPGTSMTSPSAKEEISLIGIILMAPRRDSDMKVPQNAPRGA
jgi:hypothetical protein